MGGHEVVRMKQASDRPSEQVAERLRYKKGTTGSERKKSISEQERKGQREPETYQNESIGECGVVGMDEKGGGMVQGEMQGRR